METKERKRLSVTLCPLLLLDDPGDHQTQRQRVQKGENKTQKEAGMLL